MGLTNKLLHLRSLLEACVEGPGSITILYDGAGDSSDTLTHRELLDEASIKAAYLRDSFGDATGHISLIHFQSHKENIIWFWASIIAGYVPTMSTPLVNNDQSRSAHLKHLHGLLLDPTVITTHHSAKSYFADRGYTRILAVDDPIASLGSDNSPSRRVEPFKFRIPARTSHAPNAEASTSLDNVAALMLTSGSSGNCKAVCITLEQILAASKGKLSCMPMEKATVLNWIGLDHVASLIELHITGMLAGCHQIHVPAAEVVSDPLLFLRLLSKHRVVRTFAPNSFMYKLQQRLDNASAADRQDIRLDNLLYLVSGGEPNSVDTCVRLSAHLKSLGASSIKIVPGFGMTETCAGCIYSLQCPEIDVGAGYEFASLGKCVPGVEMRITHETTHSMGNLEVRGPLVFKRYFNNIEATRESFSSDGWFRTGDQAEIDSHGVQRLTGRSKELVIVNGVKYAPCELEGAIEREQIPGIAPSTVASFAHRVPGQDTEHVQVVYERDFARDDAESRMNVLNNIIRTVLLFTGARPRVLPLGPGRQDRTTLGKLSRGKIRTAFLAGEYAEDAEVDKAMLSAYRLQHLAEPNSDAERMLMEILEELELGSLDMGVNAPVLDIGISSVDLIRLKRLTEKKFDIADIPVITMMTNATIRALAAVIDRLRKPTQDIGVYNPVVVLQPKGTKTPLWLVHPGIGEMLVFLGLTKYFSDRPMYAMRARGLNPGEKCFSGLPEVLETYYAAIKQMQSHGPYALAGYSYGSMIAFELAKMFEADGECVQFLGSFNLPPHIKTRMCKLD